VYEDEGKDVRRPGLQEEERRKGQVSQRRCDGLVRDARATCIRVYFEVGVL
jgi:hypothetical protein